MDTRILEEIGLTEGEIKTYLTLLEIGPSSTGPIANESGVSRSKLYNILDRLEKKGMTSHKFEGGVKIFNAVEPLKIKDYLIRKREMLKKLEMDFDDFLPQLESLYNRKSGLTTVSVFQGMKGLITAFEHTYLKLERGDEYKFMGIPAKQPQHHHRYWLRDHERRAKSGIRCKLLFNIDTDGSILKSRNAYPGCDARYMPINIKTPAYFLIYKDTTMIAIASENTIAVEIVSKEIADSFNAYFESMWRLSERFDA